MKFRLSVQANDDFRSWQTDDWSVLVALAAISAEPESIEEFYTAVSRYLPNHRWHETGDPGSLETSKTRDGDWCLIDLDARSVIAGESFELPDPNGSYQATETDLSVEFPIVWITIPNTWQYESVLENWRTQLAERRQYWRRNARIDVREVIYGRSMLEFVVDRCFSRETTLNGLCRDEAIRGLHAEWLMTKREDLLGKTPRDWLLGELSRLQTDLQRRADQWSRQGFPPAALDESSAAYRLGGFGTIEVVIYFEIIRTLIGIAWDRVDDRKINREVLISQLTELRDRILDEEPDDGSSGYSNRQLIELERKRMPIISDGAHLFDDCPLCRASAEGGHEFGPTFMWYDAHELELEDEFAFSTILSRVEWEQEQLEWRRVVEHDVQKQSQNEHLRKDSTTIWSSSFVDWEAIRKSRPSQLSMAIGFPLAEMISELQTYHADQKLIDAINNSYTTFRRSEDSAKLHSSAKLFKQQLEDVACQFPKLISKSADLQSIVDDILRMSD